MLWYNNTLEEILLMNFEYRRQSSYRSELALLSVFTLIFGFCCLLFGYLMLPVAAGFYAALLFYEKKESRVLSYVIPLFILVVNVFINGFYSLEAVAYVTIGAIVYLGFVKKKNKASTVFIATSVLVLLMLISLVFLAFDHLGTFKFSAVFDFCSDFYESGKIKFIEFLTAFTDVDENGVLFNKFNSSEAVDLYNSLIFLAIPFFVIFALILVGLSIKILTSRVMRYDYLDSGVLEWRFITSPFLAYSYIVIMVFSTLSSQGVVGLSLSFVSSIFMAVYFYIGICSLYTFICAKKGRGFSLISIAVLLFVFYSFAFQIISVLGVFVNNAFYKLKNKNNTDI